MSKRGYSLIELLVVMSMTSVVFTVGVGMVHRVMHEQKFANRDNDLHRVAERLSTKLREDIYRADHAELTPSDGEGEPRLVLKQPAQGVVTYAVRSHAIERTSTRESEPTHRDSFPFPENYRLAFSNVSGEHVTFTAFAIPQAYLATVREESPGRQTESEVRRAVMHLEASVGRDHRFLGTVRNNFGLSDYPPGGKSVDLIVYRPAEGAGRVVCSAILPAPSAGR